MKITFPELPPIGLSIAVDGHEFRLVQIEPHTRQDGVETCLIRWEGQCADCGERFETKSPRYSPPQSKRCEVHRKPGIKAASKKNDERK